MKVVISACFGGFSLSPRATKMLAKLNGKECYFYNGGLGEPYKKVPMNKIDLFWSAYAIKDEKELNRIVNSDYTNEEYAAIDIESRPADRADKKLIQVVEKLGKKANGRCAALKIVEIPDDVEWKIEEYDGFEHVAEKHRTWH